MLRAATSVFTPQTRSQEWAKQAAIVVGASLFVALCARVTVPLLPFTPVPLTLQNFGVLAVAMLLGPRRGCAALALYLAEGAAGLPVFNPAGVGGIMQIMGATGGFLMAYPFVAFVTGWIYERTGRRFSLAIKWGLYWFVFAEVIKIMAAAGVCSQWNRRFSRNV